MTSGRGQPRAITFATRGYTMLLSYVSKRPLLEIPSSLPARTLLWRRCLLLCALAWLPLASQAATAAALYTKTQAKAGARVYSRQCSTCHGSKLQGGAAPALTGASFGKSLKGTYPTAGKLYHFISTQMPVSNPGALGKTQYEQVLAFVLAENGYPMGTSKLDAAHLDKATLLPYPNKNKTSNLEIQNIGSASRTVIGKLPDATHVTITDAMMKSPGQHPSDWLLHGHDYANQRYSPLQQINAGNVKSLVPAALIQTGVTSSFETTPIVVNGVMYATTPVVDSKMKILAIRADTGDILWESTYDVGNFKICCGPVNRGVAVGYGNVYVTTLDDRLIALDAATGEVLGAHRGVIHYTVGQRRGLEIGGQPEPLYVTGIDAPARRVLVGPRRLLAVGAARIVETSRIGPMPAGPLAAKVRSLAKPVPVTLDGPFGDGAETIIRFASAEYGVAPGQAAVLYAGDRVVGGGWIDSTEAG